MLCRVAENMFWLSRYVERAIAVVRLIDVTGHLELDAGEADEHGEDFWTPLLGPVGSGGYLNLAPGEVPAPRDVRYHLAFDAENPNSLVSCVRRARAAAREVRESISSEMWEQINTQYLTLVDPTLATQAEDELHTFHRRVHEGLVLIQGSADCTLAHDEPWRFLSLGKYLERADNVSRVLNLQTHLLLSAGAETHGRPGDDFVRWLAVLQSCGSAEAYARYYSLRVDPPRVIEFLLLNPHFPQSVRFSLGAAWDSLSAISGPPSLASDDSSLPIRALGTLRARLDYAGVDEVLEEGLAEFLTDVQRRIDVVAERLTSTYFRTEARSGRQIAVARAAISMTGQDQ